MNAQGRMPADEKSKIDLVTFKDLHDRIRSPKGSSSDGLWSRGFQLGDRVVDIIALCTILSSVYGRLRE